MTPIDGLSDIRRLPRLGKIRLGIKKEGLKGSYPQAVDYFVCPEEVKAVYSEQPRELPIMFPSDDLDLVAPQWMKCYSYSQGLICRGDGRHCHRKVDIETGDFAGRDTKKWEMADALCDPDHCPKIGGKQCRRIMSLLFILPEVPGLGVYQLDTSSFYSIVNLNSQLAPGGFLRHFTGGRIAFIPLVLSVIPQEVTPPGVGRKTVHVLSIRSDAKLADIIRISRQKAADVLLPPVEDHEPPDDLFPEDVFKEEAPTTVPTNESALTNLPHGTPAMALPHQPRDKDRRCLCKKPVAKTEVLEKDGICWHLPCDGYLCRPPIDCFAGCPHLALDWVPPLARPSKEPLPTQPTLAAPAALKRDPSTIRTLNDLYKACNEDWQMQPKEVVKELGYSTQAAIGESPADCYRKIAAVKSA